MILPFCVGWFTLSRCSTPDFVHSSADMPFENFWLIEALLSIRKTRIMMSRIVSPTCNEQRAGNKNKRQGSNTWRPVDLHLQTKPLSTVQGFDYIRVAELHTFTLLHFKVWSLSLRGPAGDWKKQGDRREKTSCIVIRIRIPRTKSWNGSANL